jgi:hypothetical protein
MSGSDSCPSADNLDKEEINQYFETVLKITNLFTSFSKPFKTEVESKVDLTPLQEEGEIMKERKDLEICFHNFVNTKKRTAIQIQNPGEII